MTENQGSGPKIGARPQRGQIQKRGQAPLSQALPGTWRLESRIDVAGNGKRHPDPMLGEDPVALLVYDPTGHFSAQFMKRDRSAKAGARPQDRAQAPGGKNNTQAQDGYDAYFGRYSVDDASGTVTQELQGSLSKANVGMVLTREMRVEGDVLVIELDTTAADGTPVRRTLTWRREINSGVRPQKRGQTPSTDV